MPPPMKLARAASITQSAEQQQHQANPKAQCQMQKRNSTTMETVAQQKHTSTSSLLEEQIGGTGECRLIVLKQVGLRKILIFFSDLIL